MAVSESLRSLLETSYHEPSNTIFVCNYEGAEGEEVGVGAGMAYQFIRLLYAVDRERMGDNINIVLSSDGGDFYWGQAMYDAIQSCFNPTYIYGTGLVASSGSIVLQAGDVRILTPNAKLMLHYGQQGTHDSVVNAERWNEQFRKDARWMEELYLEKIRERHPKTGRARIRRLLEFDTILSAEEAVAMNLADYIGGLDGQ